MSFSLEGTHISGGTFNNVYGNMSQVINSYVSAPAGPGLIDGRPGFLDSGGLGPQRRARRGHGEIPHRPYDIPNRIVQQENKDSDELGPRYEGAGSWNSSSASTEMSNNALMTRRTSWHAPGASVENIPNSTFHSIGGDMTQVNLTSYGESGIDILYRCVSIEAFHNSGERHQEPACHPGTRTAILEELHTWSLDNGPDSQLLWLHGSAGVGKSAIAQMFAGDCVSQHRLGASFFFHRGHPKRGTWHNLFTSIAYQLAHSVPELLLPIQQAVENDKPIVGRAMAIQFQQLLVEPFRNAPASQSPPIIVLDGLDECDEHKIQQQILRLFIGGIRSGQFPARILICSRPEPHLREVLETSETFGICRHSSLSADSAAYEDIRKYLRDEFSRIHSEYANRGIDLGAPWPDAETLEHLVKKSTGIFIYAATVIRFVDDEYSHPADRLDSVLRLDPHSTSPLDDLYDQILSALPHEQQQLRILHAIWRGTLRASLQIDPEEIDMLLGLRGGTCRLKLRGLHSLLSVPPIRIGWNLSDSITFQHASFGDYLSHPHRSRQWCVWVPWLNSDYLHCMVRLLSLPPPTFRLRELYSEVLHALPATLMGEQPSQGLITLLRNRVFQDSLFLGVYWIGMWPQRGSSYPSDLICLWEEHSFIVSLAAELDSYENLEYGGSPTCKFDRIYGMILGRHLDLLFVLRARLVSLLFRNPTILEMCGLTYRVFQPFIPFRQVLDLPFPKGDSPLDFLMDPRRAANIYQDPRDVVEEMMVLYISRTKEVLLGTSDFELDGSRLSILIQQCPTSSRLLRELEALNLSQLCHQHARNWESHRRVHYEFLDPRYLCSVGDWLLRFPDPPVHAIEFWRIQMAEIERCIEFNCFNDEDD